MIATSMLVRRSSMAVGALGDMRWSNRDLQSTASMGLRAANLVLQFFMRKGPSKTSDNSNMTHSTVPAAIESDWLSAANVELTVRESL